MQPKPTLATNHDRRPSSASPLSSIRRKKGEPQTRDDLDCNGSRDHPWAKSMKIPIEVTDDVDAWAWTQRFGRRERSRVRRQEYFAHLVLKELRDLGLAIPLDPNTISGVRAFRDVDGSYLSWVTTHPDGFVINIRRTPPPASPTPTTPTTPERDPRDPRDPIRARRSTRRSFRPPPPRDPSCPRRLHSLQNRRPPGKSSSNQDPELLPGARTVTRGAPYSPSAT